MDLDTIVSEKSVIVCVGGGGVGKTTMSAAIALEAAQRGRRVCVLTIDPAKRLANAIGLDTLGNVATRVEEERFEAAGIGRPRGQLWAMMLDAKRTWDDLVSRYALTDEQAKRILANHYYQQISSALAGSQEFMAMEKLYELHDSGLYDLVVLDTPPARHALDFLDAPKKMMGFMDEGVLKLFVAPAARFGLGLFQNSSVWMLRALQRLTGFDVLQDISDFIDSFSGMHAGFRDRAAVVEMLLRSDDCSFLLVTSPHPLTVDEAECLHGKLVEHRMPFGGFVVNRVHGDALREAGTKEAWQDIARSPAFLLERLNLPREPDLAVRLVRNFTRAQAIAQMDAAEIDRLMTLCTGLHFWRLVPALDRDVHDLSGLARINRRLFMPHEPRDGPR